MKRNFYLPSDDRSIIRACLGPTNTGKTTYALERMTSYKSGVIGFPLRLLARENYDKLVQEKGVSAVALVTGEEKIIPQNARYFLCTVEAMPVERDFEFLAIDEIQLCADPERGHVFTDRLLRARGKFETMFLGAETIRPIIRELIPETEFTTRERLSELTYTGFKKLSRLPKRTAVVAFSVDDVYRYAEMIRRHRGGTAIVLGALSPRARNAQVELYQSGEVDFMVATDAIGMGLNMDINHIALAATRKFDGHRPRTLNTAEMAQIAGRAGRAKRDGTFGITGHVRDLENEVTEAIKLNTFPPLEKIIWRNHDLNFRSPQALIKSLEYKSNSPYLTKGRLSDDHRTLIALAEQKSVMDIATSPDLVRLLWDACQIPDFRKTLSDTHQALIAEIFFKLLDGYLPTDWVQKQINRLDDTEGDVDTLMTRIAHIRTWTFITHRAGWLKDAENWQRDTRTIEDKLSDALHEALTHRFVDRRTSVLVKAMEEKGELLAGIKRNGEVVVEGEKIGYLSGFQFIPDDNSGGNEYKAVMSAARSALKQEIERRMTDILNAEATQFRLQENGDICYQPLASNPLPGQRVAAIKKGDSLYSPDVTLSESDLLQDTDKKALQLKLKDALKQQIATVLEPLVKLTEHEEGVAAPVRGLAHQLHEKLGIMPREKLEDMIAGLDTDTRRTVRQKGVRLGPVLVFMPAMGKPAAIRMKAILWSLWNDQTLPAPIPRDGSVSEVVDPKAINRAYYQSIGYPVYGVRAIRADMLDRIVCEIYDTAKEGKFQAQHKMAEWLGCPIAELYDILSDLGHKKIHDPAHESEKVEASSETSVKEEKTETSTPTKATENVQDKPAETVEPSAISEEAPRKDVSSPETSEEKAVPEQKKTEQKKPELATFALKRGKASTKPYIKKDKPAGKKPYNKNKKPQSNKPNVISAKAKKSDEDNPFAILKQLKK